MMKLIIKGLLLTIFIPLLGYAQWLPAGYKSWVNSADQRQNRILLGGEIQNYHKSDSTWGKIDNNWDQINDSVYQVVNANLQVSATSNGQSTLSYSQNGADYGLQQELVSIVLIDAESDSFFSFMDEPVFISPTINDNSIYWSEVFFGIDYALIKVNGMLHHRVYFQPKFLDSLRKFSKESNLPSKLFLGSISKCEQKGSALPPVNDKILRRTILKEDNSYTIQMHQQELFYKGYETQETIPVFQKWMRKKGIDYCIEVVALEKVLEVHEKNPSEMIYHNASVTFNDESVSDTYVRSDNGSYENYNSGEYGTILLTTEIEGTSKRGCFLRFDLSSINTQVTVDSTTLHIAVVAQGDSVGLGFMTTEWSEGNVNFGAIDSEGEFGATWLKAKDSLGTTSDWDWANSSEFSELDFDDNNGNYYGVVDAETTAWNAYLHVGAESEGNNSMLVSNWINGRTENYGYCLIDIDLATGTTIRPSEIVITGFRPYLYVEYTINEDSTNHSLRRRISQRGVN